MPVFVSLNYAGHASPHRASVCAGQITQVPPMAVPRIARQGEAWRRGGDCCEHRPMLLPLRGQALHSCHCRRLPSASANKPRCPGVLIPTIMACHEQGLLGRPRRMAERGGLLRASPDALAPAGAVATLLPLPSPTLGVGKRTPGFSSHSKKSGEGGIRTPGTSLPGTAV